MAYLEFQSPKMISIIYVPGKNPRNFKSDYNNNRNASIIQKAWVNSLSYKFNDETTSNTHYRIINMKGRCATYRKDLDYIFYNENENENELNELTENEIIEC